MNKKSFKKTAALLLFLAGAAVMLYPVASDWVNRRNQSRAAASYSGAVEALDPADYEKMLSDARRHNEKLAGAGSLAAALDMEKEDGFQTYHSLLDVERDGVMGVIRIPKIRVEIPIYHTTDEGVLQVGIGHFAGSSLPVGGTDTHCILSGHRGLPSARLFTDLDQLEEGDLFYIDVLKETLAYEVDRIDVVLPQEAEGLDVIEGGDYVTLVTCTPYGVNTHRLLVRGARMDRG